MVRWGGFGGVGVVMGGLGVIGGVWGGLGEDSEGVGGGIGGRFGEWD